MSLVRFLVRPPFLAAPKGGGLFLGGEVKGVLSLQYMGQHQRLWNRLIWVNTQDVVLPISDDFENCLIIRAICKKKRGGNRVHKWRALRESNPQPSDP